jgi:flagellar motor switch protein FliG
LTGHDQTIGSGCDTDDLAIAHRTAKDQLGQRVFNAFWITRLSGRAP